MTQQQSIDKLRERRVALRDSIDQAELEIAEIDEALRRCNDLRTQIPSREREHAERLREIREEYSL